MMASQAFTKPAARAKKAAMSKRERTSATVGAP